MSIFTKTSSEIKEQNDFNRIQNLAEDFLNMINTWHSLPEITDNDLELYWLKSKLAKMEEEKKEFIYPTFSPSSASSCPRELYHKLKGDKKDQNPIQPHQTRWKKIGTLVGEMIQKDLLYIMKYYKEKTKQDPPLRPLLTEVGKKGYGISHYPAWEEFVGKQLMIQHNETEIPLLGQPDGILLDQSGNKIGLEIKTKQTSYSRTGYFSMRGIEQKHIDQLIGYSLLYGINDFIVVYLNTSHCGWDLDEEKLLKYPDLRVFGYHVTDEERNGLLDYFASIVEAVEEDKAPFPDFGKWTFNNYKESIKNSFTNDECLRLKNEIDQEIQKKNPNKVKLNNMKNFLKEYQDIRQE